MRAHIVIEDQELLEAVDSLVGKRKRSRFIEEAIRDKVKREALGRALKETAGILSAEDHPEWVTPQKVTEWVRALRAEGDAALERKLSSWKNLQQERNG